MIAFVDLDPVATEKVSVIRSNIVWNRWKSTYSEGKIHKSEPEPRNRNVNTVYFISQAGQGKTRISRTEFVYDERARDCKCLLIFELPA